MKLIGCNISVLSSLHLLLMLSASCLCNPIIASSKRSQDGTRLPPVGLNLNTPTRRVNDDAIINENRLIDHDVTMTTPRPNNVTVASTLTKMSTTNRTNVPASSNIAQASLYAGLVLFGVIVIIICMVATLVSAPDDDQTLRRHRCCRRLLHMDELTEPDACSSTRTSTPPDLHASTASIIATLCEPPPSYDEIMSVTGSAQNLIFIVDYPRDADGRSLRADSSAVDDFAVSSSTSGCGSAGNVHVRPVRESRDSFPALPTFSGTCVPNADDESGETTRTDVNVGGFFRNVSRRFVNSISPPNYFQAICDLASRGIFVNRTLLTTPPPSYNEVRRDHREHSQWTTMMTTSAVDESVTSSSSATRAAMTRGTKVSPAVM